MTKKLSILTVLNVIQMLFSLIIQVLFAFVLGADSERDSLFIAMSVPIFFNTVLTASVGVVLTPTAIEYTTIRLQRLFFNKIIVIVAILTIGIGLLFFLNKQLIIEFLAPGFNEQKSKFTANLLKYSILIIPIQAVSIVINSFWVTINRILIPSNSAIVGNIFTVVFLIWFRRNLNAEYGMIAYLGGYIVTFIIISLYYLADGLNVIVTKNEETILANHKLLFSSSIILIILIIINRSSSLIESRIASKLENGTISYLRYSSFLSTFLVGATTTPVTVAYYSDLCKLWLNQEKDKIIVFLEKGLLILTIICFTIVGAFILTIDELLLFVKDWSNFLDNQIHILSNYFKIIIFSYIFFSQSNFLGRLFYISNNFLKGAIFDLFLLLFYIVISYTLVDYFGGIGLAFATIFQSIFALVGIYWTLTKKVHNLNFSIFFFKNILITIFVWATSFLFAWFIKEIFSSFLNSFLIMFISLFIYFLFLLLGLVKTQIIYYLPLTNKIAYLNKFDKSTDIK